MNSFLIYATIGAMIATLIVMLVGVFKMMNPKKGTPRQSNKMMQMRVLLQALALAAFSILLFGFKK